ncbi:hypothetical protein [Ascidiaceihabitans sp.]|uniref:hypothetical protein n=1 Tax=Ascidiaceihabitans sp. TaxID=1872644 RepID=UPI0032984F29
MSNMENLDNKLSEAERQSVVYETAMASIAAKNRAAPAGGHAIMAAAMGYGESASDGLVMSKMAHGAKLFCILFAMLAPSLLIWKVML